MSVGRKIRELRMRKGLTQVDLGSGLVTPSMISQIESEKANPSYKVLEAIADRLETPIEYFLADVEVQLEQGTALKVAKALMASSQYERAYKLLWSIHETPANNMNMLDLKVALGECLMGLSQKERASEYLLEVVELATSKEQFRTAIKALRNLGNIELKNHKHHNALFHWRKGYELFERLPVQEPQLQGEILNSLASIHYDLGETKVALAYYQEAMQMLAHTSNFEQLGMTYLGLAMSHQRARELELAGEYATFASAIFESLKNMKLAIEAKKRVAGVKRDDNKFSESLKAFEECLETCIRHDFDEEAVSIYCEIARLYLQQKEFARCRETADKGFELAKAGSVTTASLLRVKALALGGLESYQEAIQILEEATGIFESRNRKEEVSDCFALLAELHRKKGDDKTAYLYLSKMREVMFESLKARGLVF